MRTLIMAGLFVLATVPPVAAQSKSQEIVMNHIAQALVVSNRCPALKPRLLLMSMLLKENGIDIDREPYKAFMQKRGVFYTGQLSKHRPEILCGSGKLLYGDKGQNVPHLLEEG